MGFTRCSTFVSPPGATKGSFCILFIALCLAGGVMFKYCSLVQVLIGAVRSSDCFSPPSPIIVAPRCECLETLLWYEPIFNRALRLSLGEAFI